MNIKTLLLGTATAVSMVGGAQAADLAVAEPVDYVKVCDAYGAGYFYIPGSDTCLKIGGYVKGYIDFYDTSANKVVGGTFSATTISGSLTTNVPTTSYPSNWNWTTETSVNVTAQSMTDIGLLTAWTDYRAKRVGGTSNGGMAYIDSAYLKAGPMKLGFFTNIYYYGGQYGEYGAGGAFDAADNSDNQLAFSTSFGGLGLWLGIADNSTHSAPGAYASNWPDIIAALTGSAGGFDWKLAAAATDTTAGTGWGFQAGAAWTAASGDAIRVKAAVGNQAGSYYVDANLNGNGGGPAAGGTIWSALIAGVHYWSSNVSTQLAASYTSNAGGVWNVGAETDWLVAKNFLTGVAVDYFSPSSQASRANKWQVELFAKRSF